MKSLITFIGTLIAFAAIGAVFYGGYLAMGYVWRLYATLDPTLLLILLSSFAVFLLGCFKLSGAIKSSAQLKNKGRLTEVKINLYKNLIILYGSVLSGSQLANAQLQKEIQNRLDELNPEMNLVADSSVIKAHRKLESALKDGENEDKLHMLYQHMVKKMRQELGHDATIDESRLKFPLFWERNEGKETRGCGVSI